MHNTPSMRLAFAEPIAIMLFPLKLQQRILACLDLSMLKACRLVCRDWNRLVTRSFRKDLTYHFNTASLDALSSPSLREIVKDIIVNWAMPTKELQDYISAQLAVSLASRPDISLRCYNESETLFSCNCSKPVSLDYEGYQLSSLWIALQAISSQAHIKLKSLILSNSDSDSQAEARLPEIRSLIQDKLPSLEDLVLCYTSPTKYEELRAFLSCCQNLKRLCLRVRTFRALDEMVFPSLRYLRTDVFRLDEFALKFLESHTNIEGVYISYFGWDNPHYPSTDKLFARFNKALINTSHNVHAANSQQDSESCGRLG
ncbi:hypothetical protein FOYG_16812 [Fusarium oxysporum NRRL 32931]|uniref:F-box domain-containing protein n=1 Tax=Fusarium oxysporum NRRL 32931 TaxID=660029 RepID=W9HBS7_FUSOX|nr:hypothetical protein FOYG_16812 [Fusarium oxysporum NRRL 32931]